MATMATDWDALFVGALEAGLDVAALAILDSDHGSLTAWLESEHEQGRDVSPKEERKRLFMSFLDTLVLCLNFSLQITSSLGEEKHERAIQALKAPEQFWKGFAVILQCLKMETKLLADEGRSCVEGGRLLPPYASVFNSLLGLFRSVFGPECQLDIQATYFPIVAEALKCTLDLFQSKEAPEKKCYLLLFEACAYSVERVAEDFEASRASHPGQFDLVQGVFAQLGNIIESYGSREVSELSTDERVVILDASAMLLLSLGRIARKVAYDAPENQQMVKLVRWIFKNFRKIGSKLWSLGILRLFVNFEKGLRGVILRLSNYEESGDDRLNQLVFPTLYYIINACEEDRCIVLNDVSMENQIVREIVVEVFKFDTSVENFLAAVLLQSNLLMLGTNIAHLGLHLIEAVEDTFGKLETVDSDWKHTLTKWKSPDGSSIITTFVAACASFMVGSSNRVPSDVWIRAQALLFKHASCQCWLLYDIATSIWQLLIGQCPSTVAIGHSKALADVLIAKLQYSGCGNECQIRKEGRVLCQILSISSDSQIQFTKFLLDIWNSPTPEAAALTQVLLQCDLLSSIEPCHASAILRGLVHMLADDIDKAMHALQSQRYGNQDANVHRMHFCMQTLAVCIKEASLHLVDEDNVRSSMERVFKFGIDALGMNPQTVQILLCAILNTFEACSPYFSPQHAEHCVKEILRKVNLKGMTEIDDELCMQVASFLDSMSSAFDDLPSTSIFPTVCQAWVKLLGRDSICIVRHTILHHFRSFARSLGPTIQSVFEEMHALGEDNQLRNVQEFLSIHVAVDVS